MSDQIDKSAPSNPNSERDRPEPLIYRSEQAQEEANKAQGLLQGILNAVDSSADAIIIYDFGGNAKYVSDSFTRLFGWTKEEVIGKRIPFVPESEQEVSLAQIKRLIEDGKPVSGFETKRTTKAGVVLDVNISSSRYLGPTGEPEGILVILRDITAWKSLQRARQRAVNHLSHELTTPLAIIDASLSRVAKQDLLPEQRQESVARIRRNLDRLKGVHEVVQRIVSPIVYRPRPFRIVPFVLDVLDTIRKRCSGRSVALLQTLQPVDASMVDPDVLKKVLDTMVKNAIENTPDGGTVTVILEDTASGPLLQIKDRGVGIFREDQPFIFEAFHHTQNTEHYSTKKPFDFGAGGKGLELMQLSMFAEQGFIDIRFETDRCRYLSTHKERCPGDISKCEHVEDEQGCRESGGSTFSVLFWGQHPRR